MKYFSTCLIAILPLFGLGQDDKTPILVTDLLKIKSIQETTLSPDGSRYVLTVKEIIPDPEDEKDYRYSTQLWMSAGDSLTKITNQKENAGQASFSPDGQSILFVRSVDDQSQLFLLPLSGGEATQLTDFRYGASQPVWSPDGSKIVFSASIPLMEYVNDSLLNPGKSLPKWPSEKPGIAGNEFFQESDIKPDPDGTMESIRAYLAENEKDNKAKVIHKLGFQTESETSSSMRINHLFLIDLAHPEKTKAITSGFQSCGNPYFLGNDQLVYSTQAEENTHPDRAQSNKLVVSGLDGSDARTLLQMDDQRLQVGATSKSGKWMIYTQSATNTPDVGKVFLVSPSQPDTRTDLSIDRSAGSFIFTEDERQVYFLAQRNGGAVLYRSNLKGQPEALTSEDEGVTSFAVGPKKVLFSLTSPTNPSELYEATLNLKNREIKSSLNSRWLANKSISLPEKHRFTNDQGMEVEYWVMKPKNFQAHQKYPLLLEIHGGPSAMWGPGEAGMWHEFQYFCSQGYGVVYSNPRGSGGYGNDFLRANIGDWGAGPTKDVLTALDKTVEEGWADTSRMVVSGGSYAGYLVNWIVGHDQRFKAACSQRGVYDLNTFFGEGNAWRLVPNYFGGYPWEKEVKALLDSESPLSYVENIHTPYIIFHGENDLRTGVIQSEMLYKSLKVLGRPVEYVRHPGATHEITRSGDNRQRIDQMLRTYEFFERYIR